MSSQKTNAANATSEAAIQEIAEVLTTHGATFSGGTAVSASDLAREWADCGFDADDVSDWCDAQVWEPSTAHALSQAGVDADEVADIAANLEDAEPDREWVGGGPVYTLCNNDMTVAAFLTGRE